MFKPLMAAGVAGLTVAALIGCAKPPASSENVATLLVSEDSLAGNEQADLVYRRNDWRDEPGDPVTYIYGGGQYIQAGKPALVEIEMARQGRPRTYCGRRFSFVPARGRVYQVTPTFEGTTCSVELTDVRTGRTPESYRLLPDISVRPLPDLPPPTSIEWLDD